MLKITSFRKMSRVLDTIRRRPNQSDQQFRSVNLRYNSLTLAAQALTSYGQVHFNNFGFYCTGNITNFHHRKHYSLSRTNCVEQPVTLDRGWISDIRRRRIGLNAHSVTQSWADNSLSGQGIVNTGHPYLFHGPGLVHELQLNGARERTSSSGYSA